MSEVYLLFIIYKTLLKTALVRRLQCSDYSVVPPYQVPANHSITSSLNWLPILYIVNAKALKLPAQMGHIVVPMA